MNIIREFDMVDTDTVTNAANFLSSGSISAVIGLLIFVILGLLWERIRILKQLDEITAKVLQFKKEELDSVKNLIEMYHQGNIGLVQTLTEIKSVLSNIYPGRR